MADNWRLGCIGVGAMGQALVKGIVRAAMVRPNHVHVADANAELRDHFAKQWVLRPGSNTEVAEAADVLLIAVKPPHVSGVLTEVAPYVKADTLLISVAAGVPLATLETAVGKPIPIIRAMPNIPCLVGEGAVAYSLGRWATAEHGRRAATLLGAVAEVVMVPESQMNAVTGLSGSGPAYVFQVIEALIDAGVAVGLDRQTARTLVVHTVAGSARLLAETGEHPAALKNAVTSPGGTTATGLAVLERRALTAAFLDAVRAATERADELGRPRLVNPASAQSAGAQQTNEANPTGEKQSDDDEQGYQSDAHDLGGGAAAHRIRRAGT